MTKQPIVAAAFAGAVVLVCATSRRLFAPAAAAEDAER
jgi:hypothetical protein